MRAFSRLLLGGWAGRVGSFPASWFACPQTGARAAPSCQVPGPLGPGPGAGGPPCASPVKGVLGEGSAAVCIWKAHVYHLQGLAHPGAVAEASGCGKQNRGGPCGF